MGTDPTTDSPAVVPPADSPTPSPGAGEFGTSGPGSLPRSAPGATTGSGWLVLARPDEAVAVEPPLPLRRLLLQLAAGIVVALLVVTIGGSLASRRLAEREAVTDAASTADVLAEAVVQPALTDALLDSDPKAVAAFDRLVQRRILGDGVVRLKIWSPQGRIVYSDQPDLIGRSFGLEEEERDVLRHPKTQAEISDLDRPENALDRRIGAKLVEVYRPVWTPSGRTALFEIYTPYDQVSQRTGQLWRGFAGVTLSSLLLFILLVAPILVHLLRRARRAGRQRELLLQRAVDASASERRRIAASLHDGPVQDLAATSFAVAGATARAEAAGHSDLAAELRHVAGGVRTSIRALRSLLVDIYPPSLARAGLGAALVDLIHSVQTPDLQVRVDLADEDALGLDDAQQRLVFRAAQEMLRNAAKHAGPCTVRVSLRPDPGEGRAVLEVQDDGAGFDPAERAGSPESGHLGLQLLTDLATRAGAELAVRSAPGAGTRWRLVVPDTDQPTDQSAHQVRVPAAAEGAAS